MEAIAIKTKNDHLKQIKTNITISRNQKLSPIKRPCRYKAICEISRSVCTKDYQKWCTPLISKKLIENIKPDQCAVMLLHKYSGESAKCNIPQIKELLENNHLSCNPKMICITEFLSEKTRDRINGHRSESGFTDSIPQSFLKEIWSEIKTAAKNNQ